jgi:hypothetical protein
MTARLVVAMTALVALVCLDWFLLAVAFLYGPTSSEWIGIAALVALAVAIAFRLRWLIFSAQTGVTAVLVYRMVGGLGERTIVTSGSRVISLLFVVSLLLLAFGLAWLIARELPPRSRKSG